MTRRTTLAAALLAVALVGTLAAWIAGGATPPGAAGQPGEERGPAPAGHPGETGPLAIRPTDDPEAVRATPAAARVGSPSRAGRRNAGAADTDRPALVVVVIDGAGVALERFEVRLHSGAHGHGPHVLEGTRGRLELGEDLAGSYRIWARADGHHPSALVEVELPREEPLELVLFELGRVAGTVTDPRGRPVAGARVVTPDEELEADAAGRFEFRLSTGTATTLFAGASGFGPSEVHELEVAPGQRVEVELVLAPEAVIRGLVLDGDGRAEPGAEVSLGSLVGDLRARGLSREADAAGRFEFRGLAAGAYLVVVDEGGAPDAGERPLRIEQVELEAGRTVEVVLGGAREHALELDLAVTRDGVPLAKSRVFVFPEGPGFLERTSEAVLDEAGRALLPLAGPGRYRVRTEVSERDVMRQVMRSIEVPDVARFELALDLEAGTGSLSGRLSSTLGPDHPVFAILQDAWDPADPAAGSDAHVDGDGRFTIEGLEPGLYVLETPGAAPIAGIALGPGEHLGGFELAVADLGLLAGRVQDADGRAVRGAHVFLRDGAGRWVLRWNRATSGPGGRFEFEHLPPGDYTVVARHGELASAESAPVTVEADRASSPAREVTLVLAPGAMARLSLVDARGAPVDAVRLTVLDAAGRGHHEQRTPHDLELLLREGYRAGGRVVGPLAPGRYRIQAVAGDGRAVERSETLGPGWSDVRLRLP